MKNITPNDIISNIIIDKSQSISNIFSKITESNFISKRTFELKQDLFCSKYINLENITHSTDFFHVFDYLKKHEQYPAIYVFGVNTDINYNDIIKRIREVEHYRTPALNNYKVNTGTLYVGKVKKILWGRLIQHLGYHSNQKSHGLQLHYWINKLKNPNISFSVFFLSKESADYIEILEKEISIKLKPIIGKH